MVTSTHGNALLIEERTHLWNRNTIEHKRHHADTILRITDERQSLYLAQLLSRIFSQLVLVVFYITQADTADIVERRTQSDGISHIRCASLKACWWLPPCHGCILSSISFLPYTTPMPLGP